MWEEAFSFFARGNSLDLRRVDVSTVAFCADSNIAVFTKRLILDKLSGRCSSSGDNLIFIVGMPRSGSSLLEQILASHHDVHAGGEQRRLSDAISTIAESGTALTGYPDCMRTITPTSLESIASAYLRGVRARAGASACNRFTDKTLDNWTDLGLLTVLFPDAKLLHCVRDARDTCLSIFFHHFQQISFSNDLRCIAAYYNQYARMMAHWREVLPRAPLEVVYEDLVDDPESVVRRVLTHCGLEWNAKCLEFHRTKRMTVTASAYQVKQPIYTSSVGRWRKYRDHIQPLLDELDAGARHLQDQAHGRHVNPPTVPRATVMHQRH